LTQYPETDSTQEEVMAHIQFHFLHPAVHVSGTLRNLLHLSNELNKVTVNTDTDDGSPLIDTRSVQLYLKVVNEIMQIYKNTDVKKLLYADFY
jgi:hypothetical protein